MLIVGIAGGTGSGKTTVVKKIISEFPNGEVIELPQDAYYRDNSGIPLEERQKINFDHPDSVDLCQGKGDNTCSTGKSCNC
jgi:uridine kinase